MNFEYSDKEISMFKALGLESVLWEELTPSQVYKLAVNRAFNENLQNDASESLRRCNIAFDKGMYRMTPEFEDLIRL